MAFAVIALPGCVIPHDTCTTADSVPPLSVAARIDQTAKTGNWREAVAVFLGIDCVLFLIAGAAAGSKERREVKSPGFSPKANRFAVLPER